MVRVVFSGGSSDSCLVCYEQLARQARAAFEAKPARNAAPQQSSTSPTGKMKVFILAGQSNMVGWGDSLQLSDDQRNVDDRTLMFENSRWFPTELKADTRQSSGW